MLSILMFLNVSFAVLCVMASVALGALTASKLVPFNPSDYMDDPMPSRESAVYAATQLRLHELRQARSVVPASEAETVKVRRDETDPDIRLSQTFAVVPVRVVSVS